MSHVWTVIADTTLEPGKPARSIDAIALRDNPIAIAEGAAGAPKVLSGALNDYPWGAEDFQTGTAERDWVLARTASASVGAVGTYAFARGFSDAAFGGTESGSNLTPVTAMRGFSVSSSVASASFSGSGGLSGTWRCMGDYDVNVSGNNADADGATLWLRIS